MHAASALANALGVHLAPSVAEQYDPRSPTPNHEPLGSFQYEFRWRHVRVRSLTQHSDDHCSSVEFVRPCQQHSIPVFGKPENIDLRQRDRQPAPFGCSLLSALGQYQRVTFIIEATELSNF